MHPPLTKLLFGLTGWFVGFDGKFKFDNIGDSYTENHVPYVGMRAFPAILGSLTVPLIYAIMKESGYSNVVAAFSAILILFGAFASHDIGPYITNNDLRQCTHRTITPYPPGCATHFLHVRHDLLLYPFPQAPLQRILS